MGSALCIITHVVNITWIAPFDEIFLESICTVALNVTRYISFLLGFWVIDHYAFEKKNSHKVRGYPVYTVQKLAKHVCQTFSRVHLKQNIEMGKK